MAWDIAPLLGVGLFVNPADSFSDQGLLFPALSPNPESHIFAVHPVSDSISCDVERRANLLGQCQSDKSPHELKPWNADSFYRLQASVGCYEPNSDRPIFVLLPMVQGRRIGILGGACKCV